jgi:3-(3-hydroxy-phenyl)propionate hydroxylase
MNPARSGMAQANRNASVTTAPFPTRFAYARSADQGAGREAHHPVVVIGAGPVGLALAIDLGLRGIPVVVLDDADRIGDGSRAICFAKKTLEIFDRLGVGKPMVERGITWNVGRVFHRDAELYAFDLLPETGHGMPAFINLPQFTVEAILVAKATATPGVDLRWKNRVVGLAASSSGASVEIDTPDGIYRINADYVVACDGARSPTRALMGLDFAGRVFEDRFLIADVRMIATTPTERWFWFDPPFHGGQSALLHRQPDDIWRIDLQLGWDADPEHEKRPEIVGPRIARMLGHDRFALEWVSIYTFQCRRLEHFYHGRVLFAGDAAHQVSPFGARGANSGIQDAENLAWKLAAVVKGVATAALLESYDVERGQAADENILNSSRATDFIAPRHAGARRYREAVLNLAVDMPFARRMLNSGRLSTPTSYDTVLSTPDLDSWASTTRPGSPMPDAPVVRAGAESAFFLASLPATPCLVVFGPAPQTPDDLAVLMVGTDIVDCEGLLAKRLDATPGSAFLLRPDHHLAARWRHPTNDQILAALDRLRGKA